MAEDKDAKPEASTDEEKSEGKNNQNESGKVKRESEEEKAKKKEVPKAGNAFPVSNKLILILVVIAVAGGVMAFYMFFPWNGDEQEATIRDIVSAHPIVKNFLGNYTHNSMEFSYFRLDDAELIFKQMRSDCQEPNSTIEEVYRVIISDRESEKALAAWLDWNEKRVVCVIRAGNWNCTNHSYYACYNNDIYWYNSCKDREGIKEDCFAICKNNTCAPMCLNESMGGDISYNISCCGNLTRLPNSTMDENGSCIPPVNESYVCTNCGNELCENGENNCNCPYDCNISCIDYDGGRNYYQKGNLTRGENVFWDACKNFTGLVEYYCEQNASRSEEIQCPEDYECYYGKCVNTTLPCLQEGEVGEKFPWNDCCAGLTKGEFISDVSECEAYGTMFICINCGDGACGIWENVCNCPQDCS